MRKDEWKGKRYICLVRASNAGEETSVRGQLELLNNHAEKLGMIYVDQVVLEGVTGSMPARREDLLKLFERKRTANDFDVLVLQRFDRLTRSGPDHGFWVEHECKLVGIRLMFVGEDVPEGRFSSLIKAAKYESAQEQAFSISQRCTQGQQLALEEGRILTTNRTPYGCWRLYLKSDGTPSHIIRNLGDGRQQKLIPETYDVVDTYGEIGGGGRGHYVKQRGEKVLLMPGDSEKVEVVRQIFRLHYLDGWGCLRIADWLNRQGISSPSGKGWRSGQVQVIYEQEAYTGRSIGNRESRAIYHRRASKTPQPVDLDPTLHATLKNLPISIRPQEEWYVQEQPLMVNFLDQHVRELAMAEHERIWKTRLYPERPKRHKNQHVASDYLLSGLMVAKQDGEKMSGVLCGHGKKQTRYYRHRRFHHCYCTNSLYNRMFRAEPLEQAVLDVMQQVLSDRPHLEDRIRQFVIQQINTLPGRTGGLEQLKTKREAVRKKTAFIVSTLDEATLADARIEIERLGKERQMLEEQIAAAEAVARGSDTDPELVVRRAMDKLARLSENLKSMPKLQLRGTLGLLVERMEADLETRQVKIELGLPSSVVWEASGQEKAVCLLTTTPRPTGQQTHQTPALMLDVADCAYVLKHKKSCYKCSRRPRLGQTHEALPADIGRSDHQASSEQAA